MSGSSRRKKATAFAAGVLAASMMLPITAYAAGGEGGGGSSGGGTGTGDGSGKIAWVYQDSFGSATAANVRKAIQSKGTNTENLGANQAQADATINEAITNATRECEARSTAAGNKDPQCRLVSVGFVYSTGGLGNNYTGATGGFNAAAWQEAYGASGIPSKTWQYKGVNYTTSSLFSDGKTTINSLVKRETDKAPKSIVAIVLSQYEPPTGYKLQVTTTQSSPANMKVGSTDPVHDVIHATGGDGEKLNATVILHYDGQRNGYAKAASRTRSIQISSKGDTRTPDIRPADLGMKHWQEGTYWWDVKVAKQKGMTNSVDTADREASEQFRVSAVPPAKPVKTVEKGQSASTMTNRTVISHGTGRGGYEMRFRDVIRPNGVTYTISNYKLVDRTDGRDVSGEFTINWDRTGNEVTAVRPASKGEMPLDHTYEFSFDVTVSKPDFSKVQDDGHATWNQEPEADAGTKEFPTWKPNPDKSWIKKDANGKWAAVIDPDETNRTGADDNTFLDGDEVASAVNGIIGADLIQTPTRFELADDWTASDYIFDANQGTEGFKVYEADAADDHETSVNDIANTGRDVTDEFTIVRDSATRAHIEAKPEYLAKLKGMKNPLQVTLIVPGRINFANGKGAEQVRKDFAKKAGDELTFCTAPGPDGKPGAGLTNKATQIVNDHTEPTNQPRICGYVPPAEKDVIGEGSEGGDQSSVDGKTVYPGQKVEYQLTTQPKLPASMGYTVRSIAFTDQYDQWLEPDKQTVEMTDLNTGKVIPKSRYTTKWDDTNHLFSLTVTDQDLIGQWRAGTNPRVQIRFEGTVSKDAPGQHKVGNKWMLTLNNSLTPSNEVFNTPPDFTPDKQDTQGKDQGDPSISIDGRTLLLGDTGRYVVTLDARQHDQAYKVWKLGITDDYDEQYLDIDVSKIEVIGSDGKDYTSGFNIADKDGVAYVYAKTVDTKVDATGETIKGDPQPSDLKAYAETGEQEHDPLKDPAIDQNLLGRTYQVILPYTVTKVTDGYTVRNKATQIVNDVRKDTNEVSNPLKPINPSKDVTVKVGGQSVDGKSIYLGSTFLYQLDSSIIPANRAYQQVGNWGATDRLDPNVDQLTGQWAVYAARDLYRDGKVIAAKGERIAGSGFDPSKLGGDMFTASINSGTGLVQVQATDEYLKLVSADTTHEQGWRLYLQAKRVKVVEHHENRWTEHYNGKDLESNIVWTRTPDLTPSIRLEKWDEKSGWPKGDRDRSKDALDGAKDGDTIVFTITNTSRTDNGHGAWFRAKDLRLEDHTIVGTGVVKDLRYPKNWDTLILKPGQSVDVKGTLKGMTGDRHTDRASVTGTPLVECPATDPDPFGDKTGDGTQNKGPNKVTIDGRELCEDTKVASNTDDWNGRRTIKPAIPITPGLARTGAAISGIAALTALATAGGIAMIRRRRTADR